MTSARRSGWAHSLHFAALTTVQWGMAVARRLLPMPVKRRLARVVRLTDTVLGPATQMRFERRQRRLDTWQPVMPASAFAGGPIVLANNGLAAGGVERQVVNTLLGLQQRGRSAGLLCLRLHTDPEFDFFLPALADFKGFIRNIMPAKAAPRALAAALSQPVLDAMRGAVAWMPRDVVEDVLRFAAEFATVKPSVVHAWQDSTNIAAAYGAWLVGVPRILISTRNLNPTNFAYFRAYMLHAYREIAACPTIVMINNSEAGARDYAAWLDIPRERFVVKRNGIDTRVPRPQPDATAALRASLGIPQGAKVVGSIYRFYPEKRPLLWVEAAARVSRVHPDCHFVVFGEGPLQASVLDAARRHGFADRFHSPGNIAASALGLSLFDVFLLTSKFEGTPNVVLEATLLGVPVVGTDAGGTREAIAQGQTGLVAAAADPDAVAQSVLAVLADPSWRTRVATHGAAFVAQNFGLARMVDETVALYDQAPPAVALQPAS